MREKPPYLRLVSSEPQEVDASELKSLRDRLAWRGITVKDMLLALLVASLYLFAGAILLFGIFNL